MALTGFKSGEKFGISAPFNRQNIARLSVSGPKHQSFLEAMRRPQTTHIVQASPCYPELIISRCIFFPPAVSKSMIYNLGIVCSVLSVGGDISLVQTFGSHSLQFAINGFESPYGRNQ